MKRIGYNYILCMCMIVVSVSGGVLSQENVDLGSLASKLFDRDSALDTSNDLTKVIPNVQKTVPAVKDIHDKFYDSTGLHSQHKDIVKTVQLDSSRNERTKRHYNSAHHRRCHPKDESKVEYDPEHNQHHPPQSGHNSYHYHYHYYTHGDEHHHHNQSEQDESTQSKTADKDMMMADDDDKITTDMPTKA